jgi:hypothetical protein
LVRRYATGANVRDQTTLGYLSASLSVQGHRIPGSSRAV